jgi:hypothetical protein
MRGKLLAAVTAGVIAIGALAIVPFKVVCQPGDTP